MRKEVFTSFTRRLSLAPLALAAAVGGCGGADSVVTGAGGSSGATGSSGTAGATGTSGTGGDATGSGNGGAGGAGGHGSTGASGGTGTTGSAGATGGTGSTDASGGTGASGVTGTAPVDSGGVDATLDAGVDGSNPALVDSGCNTLTNLAPTIESVVSDAAVLPATSGGTLVSGTYFLTAITAYNGSPVCAGKNVEGTIVVDADAGTIDGIITYDIGVRLSTRLSGTYAEDGTLLDVTPTCGSGAGVATVMYSATDTQVTVEQAITVAAACGTAVEVYTKQ